MRLQIPIHIKDHSLGPVDAPLQLLEYGDYECSRCGTAYPIVRKLLQSLGQEIQFVFRNFPHTIDHPNALNAAKSAEAAGKQGKFWKMHELLFMNQQQLDPENLARHTQSLNLDLLRFVQDTESLEVENRILEDCYQGARSGVQSTPTFFMNGEIYDGALTQDDLLLGLSRVWKRPYLRMA